MAQSQSQLSIAERLQNVTSTLSIMKMAFGSKRDDADTDYNAFEDVAKQLEEELFEIGLQIQEQENSAEKRKKEGK